MAAISASEAVPANNRFRPRKPYDAHCLGSLGLLLISADRPDEGIEVLRQAHQPIPEDPRIYLWLRMESHGHFVAGRYDEAAAMAQEALARRPVDPELRAWVATCLSNVGRADEARAVLADGEPIDRAFIDRILVVLPPERTGPRPVHRCPS